MIPYIFLQFVVVNNTLQASHYSCAEGGEVYFGNHTNMTGNIELEFKTLHLLNFWPTPTQKEKNLFVFPCFFQTSFRDFKVMSVFRRFYTWGYEQKSSQNLRLLKARPFRWSIYHHRVCKWSGRCPAYGEGMTSKVQKPDDCGILGLHSAIMVEGLVFNVCCYD